MNEAIYTLLNWLTCASLIGIAVVIGLKIFLHLANRNRPDSKREGPEP